MKIEVVDSTVINAQYVWIEDKIYITSEALNRLDDSLLTALIAHEIGHRKLQHGWRAIALEGASVVATIWYVPALWSGDVARWIAVASGLLLICALQRVGFEFEADAAAAKATSWKRVALMLSAIRTWNGNRSRLTTLRWKFASWMARK